MLGPRTDDDNSLSNFVGARTPTSTNSKSKSLSVRSRGIAASVKVFGVLVLVLFFMAQIYHVQKVVKELGYYNFQNLNLPHAKNKSDKIGK
jgi:hypothetical protein